VDPVRIGVVGLGWWACDVHIPNFLRVPDARIVGLCSRSRENLDRGRALLGDGPTPLLFSSYGELLASDAIDAVVVCTPNSTHASFALEALRAGKHVLVEKPLATDVADCRAVVEEAEHRGLVLQVGVELRYSDVVQTMRRLIDEGAIGQPVAARTHVWRDWGTPGGWRADVRQSGGLFFELAIHYIDLLNYLAARPPAWVAAAGGARVTGRDIDHTSVLIGYEGNALGNLSMCLFAAGAREEIPIEVAGTEGRLAGEIVGGRVEQWARQGEAEDRSPQRGDAEISGFPGSLESAAAFVECVQTGGRPLADGPGGEELCRVCDAARLSLAAGGQPRTPGTAG
jgi:predicted dehydrogenase